MLNHTRYENVRPDTLDAIDRYVSDGIPTGSFLEAVLCNDLMEAMGPADMKNRLALFKICDYIYNETPSGCHGSIEKVKEWVKIKRENLSPKTASQEAKL